MVHLLSPDSWWTCWTECQSNVCQDVRVRIGSTADSLTRHSRVCLVTCERTADFNLLCLNSQNFCLCHQVQTHRAPPVLSRSVWVTTKVSEILLSLYDFTQVINISVVVVTWSSPDWGVSCSGLFVRFWTVQLMNVSFWGWGGVYSSSSCFEL